MKTNKKQIETLKSFMAWGGCMSAGTWTNGSGRYITKRQPPVGCTHMPISEAVKLPGKSGRDARKMHKARPRVNYVVIVTNRRLVNRILKECTK